MASKKKEKAAKNNTSSVLSSKNASQPQKGIIQPAKNKKTGHEIKANRGKSGTNPAKSPEQTSNGQTPSAIWRKDKETNSSRGGATGAEVQRFSLKISQFLNEVLAEFRKINWPERSQVARETISVLFLVLLITSLVWAFDLIVGKFVFSPLEHWGHLYGIGARN